MKVLPSKNDFENIFDGCLKRQTKLKLKNDGAYSMLNLLYLTFVREVATETNKLMSLDTGKSMRKEYVFASSKKLLNKYSYAEVVRRKLRSQNENVAPPLSANDSEDDSSEPMTDEV